LGGVGSGYRPGVPTTIPALGRIAFSPGAEAWIEYGPPGARRRVGFHDYAALYAVPGLYERVFYDELGMRTTDELIDLYAAALETLGRPPAAERVLDLGAGNGIAGERLRAQGVGTVVGVDLEPAARDGAMRDRPGVYDDYLVADLGADPAARAALRERSFTSLLAVSAIGVGHIPLELLADAIEDLLEPGGLFGFAVSDDLLPGFHEAFFGRVGARVLGVSEYVHRRQADGSDHGAVAVLAQRAG
jgi:predicted TPR repeat methyltransferase